MEIIAEENDHAERLGFTCEPDDRRGFGFCLFKQNTVRVWNGPEGWTRAQITGHYHNGDNRCYTYGARKFYHTLDQALRDVNPFLAYDEYGPKP